MPQWPVEGCNSNNLSSSSVEAEEVATTAAVLYGYMENCCFSYFVYIHRPACIYLQQTEEIFVIRCVLSHLFFCVLSDKPVLLSNYLLVKELFIS